MTGDLEVTYEGVTHFVVTQSELESVRIGLRCPTGLVAGTDVRISVSHFHALGWGDWVLEGIEIAEGSGRVVVGHGLPRVWTDLVRGGVAPAGGGLIGRPVNEVYMCTVQVTQSLSRGAHLVFSFRLKIAGNVGLNGALLVKVREPVAEHFVLVGEPVQFTDEPGPVTRLEIRTTPMPDLEGRIRAVVFATDDMLNPTPEYEGTVTFRSGDRVEGLPNEAAIPPGGRLVFDALRVGGDAPVRIEARDIERNLAAQSGPVLSSPIRGQRHFFGSIHFHTRLSVDGSRDPCEAYAYARDYLNLDVVAMADHAPIGQRWEKALEVNEAFNEPGRFVTIPAWESSTAYGHANLYLRSPDVDAGPWYWDPERNPSEITWNRDAVLVPHHPNEGSLMLRGTHREVLGQGVYWSKYDWTVPNDRARLVEIARGYSQETDDPDPYWGVEDVGHRASVRDAFRIGWRLGFVAGTDNHQGYPSQRSGEYVDLTCFRAPELTREAIWQAMDRRHTYATSGVPIVCDFQVNGHESGSEAKLGKNETVRFSATLHGTGPIETVEIISDDRCVWQSKPDTWDVELRDIPLPPPAGKWAYYYLRLRQADAHMAWLSPVWLDRDPG